MFHQMRCISPRAQGFEKRDGRVHALLPGFTSREGLGSRKQKGLRQVRPWRPRCCGFSNQAHKLNVFRFLVGNIHVRIGSDVRGRPCVHAKSLQSVQLFVTPMDCSPPGSSVHGILQGRILEWVAMPSSRGSYWPRDRTCVSYISCISRQFLYHQHHLGSRVGD